VLADHVPSQRRAHSGHAYFVMAPSAISRALASMDPRPNSSWRFAYRLVSDFANRYNSWRMNDTVGNLNVEAVRDEVRTLVDRYRSRCLWFLRPDYYPQTDAEVRRVLMYLERYGDRDVFTRAASLRRWLSPPSSAASAAS
jgi:hypothetical protein